MFTVWEGDEEEDLTEERKNKYQREDVQGCREGDKSEWRWEKEGTLEGSDEEGGEGRVKSRKVKDDAPAEKLERIGKIQFGKRFGESEIMQQQKRKNLGQTGTEWVMRQETE